MNFITEVVVTDRFHCIAVPLEGNPLVTVDLSLEGPVMRSLNIFFLVSMKKLFNKHYRVAADLRRNDFNVTSL